MEQISCCIFQRERSTDNNPPTYYKWKLEHFRDPREFGFCED